MLLFPVPSVGLKSGMVMKYFMIRPAQGSNNIKKIKRERAHKVISVLSFNIFPEKISVSNNQGY